MTKQKCYPGYNTKLHLMVRLEIWGEWNIPLLPLLPGPLWGGVVVLVRVQSVVKQICSRFIRIREDRVKKNS